MPVTKPFRTCAHLHLTGQKKSLGCLPPLPGISWGLLGSPGSWHPTVKGKLALVIHHEPGRTHPLNCRIACVGTFQISGAQNWSTQKLWYPFKTEPILGTIQGHGLFSSQFSSSKLEYPFIMLENDPEQSSS